MARHPVILIVAQSEQACAAVRQLLGDLPDGLDWQLLLGVDDASTQALIDEIKPSCIVLAYALNERSAVDWIADFNHAYPERFTPMVVITDSEQQAEAIASLGHQPSAFFPRQSSSTLHLKQTITNCIETAQLMADTAHQSYQLAHQLNTDFLTELHSRVAFEYELNRLVDHYEKSHDDAIFAVLLIDLDDFKEVNGTLGHVAGDQLIQQVAERINGAMRENDFLSRPGGDEFTIIMAELPSNQVAGHKAEELASLFDAPFYIDDHEVRITVSIGVVCYPIAGTSLAELMSHVDIAMYRAKKEGGNGWRYYTESVNKAFYADLRLENAMRLAIQNDELFLLYQPQYRLKDRVLVGAEVLMRWDRPDVGIVSPVEFIPLAEQSGMIHAVGHWLIESVFQKIVSAELVKNPCKLVINLSAKQLEAEGFAQAVKEMMDKYKVTPKQFSFELTESALMMGALIEKNLFMLADYGIQFAIDDFGTGYSSLSYLRKLPVDTIKIDRSFITDVTTNINDARLVKSILSMAANLQLKVIAEGIETEDQMEFLHKNHCDIVQGYYCSRPLMIEDFAALLSSSD
ncbi:MAG: bifunctional diguanylate cyclase/phosphodiesterase [Coxiellaceae bacterium]|nr:bifunctional diguanylate cyclase/phosphodiesterase [Coxiellaceae bacterium]